PGNAHESRPSASTSLALTALPTVRGSIDTKPRASRRVCRLSASFNKEFLTRRHCPRIVLGITTVVPMAELGQDGSARSRISYAVFCWKKKIAPIACVAKSAGEPQSAAVVGNTSACPPSVAQRTTRSKYHQAEGDWA